jgi:hypothetical protein
MIAPRPVRRLRGSSPLGNLLAFLLAGALAPFAPAAAPGVEVLDQVLAIKDVCAWPKLVLHPSGEIFAALYNQPAHGVMPGDVACWASIDGGVTWSLRGNVSRHTGQSAWMNHAIGVAANRDLLVTSSGWSLQPNKTGKQGKPFVPEVWRSADGGRSWRGIARFPESPEPGKSFIPFGRIERGSDGHLRLPAYAYARGLPPPRIDTGYIIASADDGATWKIESVMGRPEVNETSLLHVGGGRWLAAARNLGGDRPKRGHSIDVHLSEDNARTWRSLGRVTQPNQHPGDLLKLADGRIVLTYGDRRGPQFGVNAMISADGGATWSVEVRLATGLASRDSGYPSSVQLGNGTIVTAYYAKGAREYPGYHMGVVRWRLR